MTVEYKLTIRTGTKLGAGTDANISIVLVGTRGQSAPCVLDKHFHNDFEAGAEDEYALASEDLGDLVLLRFSNAGGVAADWLLDWATVTAGEKQWRFLSTGGCWVAPRSTCSRGPRSSLAVQAASASPRRGASCSRPASGCTRGARLR
ncbi:PLAT/LH2 domain-containing protein [Myxococcus sp. MxC21-1]|uniref:PLAT/LH2 domain-containing protein n=1 Tax=Myxococcus sp. MxC21-1 TaxID=3041439 RepID=UPI0029303321|nr:PLAT/LH2 domain-containing protein [Myxococcus sp. MxC21-1]WNZ63964.1 PLAT/LH2 domain-containing protein [Myxococcus sp. MxC21-1]